MCGSGNPVESVAHTIQLRLLSIWSFFQIGDTSTSMSSRLFTGEVGTFYYLVVLFSLVLRNQVRVTKLRCVFHQA